MWCCREEPVVGMGNEIAGESVRMKKHWWPGQRGIVYAIGGAVAAAIAAPVMVGLALKALGLLHGGSLHAWLQDVGHNLPPIGAAGGAGAGAGAGGEPTPPINPKDPDPCAGERRAVLADQGTVDMYNGQLQTYSQQINALGAPAERLLDQAAEQAEAAQSEVEQQFALTAITKLIGIAMAQMGSASLAPELLGGSEAAEGVEAVNKTIEGVSNPLSQVPGQNVAETGNFVKEMYQYFQVAQGNLEALEELCKENPMPEAHAFLETMTELNQLVTQGYALVNALNQVQDKLNDAKDKLDQDQQALADCEASNGGGDSGAGVN